ncbi:MAG: hypothetical protein IT378_13045 [Sandaracinaceae bacterium]|nr:hypothetical protein [Sandaracinaceae bacterium]
MKAPSQPDEELEEGLGSVVVRRAPVPGMGPRSLAAARAIAEALFQREVPPPRARLDWMAHELGDFLGNVSLRARWVFRLSVFALTWIGPLVILRLPPLARLDLQTRARVLDGVEGTPLSLALLAVKAILCIIYFEHPDSAREIGWDQRCMVVPEEASE